MKRYFLKDKSLNNVDEDQFRYQDFSNNLRKLIEYNETPFNIALIGKWGLGKSSIINMALAPLRKKERRKDYLICEINAWKYEKDEVGKAFLKELYEGIRNKKVLSFHFFHKDYSEGIEKAFRKNKKDPDNKDDSDDKESLKNFCKYLFFIWILSIVAFTIYCAIGNDFYGIKFELRLFLESTVLRYCKNIGSILIIPIVVWLGKLFMDKLNKPSCEKYEINFPLVTQADYEIYLNNLLNDFYSENPNRKIIVVIDDLDRLSAEKIVEALDALKLFMEYERFIFIVPFDDEILKNALKLKRINEIGTYGNEYDGEMVLDKIFQYKMYLPQLIKYDMRNYALKICKNDCVDFIKEYCDGDEKLFEEIVGKILVHSGVSTPRQVKKIINTFIGNVMIARDRQQGRKVGEKFATEKAGLETIAKISVLQSDYNKFYDLLFKDTNAVNEILEVHRSRGESVPSELLKNYFDENNVLDRQYESLVNYLSFTENLGHENITPYLYMAQTKEGVLVGDKKQQDFMAAIESCNFISAKSLVKETPILASLFIEQLKYNESPLMGNIILSAIDCYDVVPETDKEELAISIVERIPQLSNVSESFRYDLINEKNLVLVCHKANSNEHNSLVQYAINRNQRDGDYENKLGLINKVSEIKDDLSETTFSIFTNYTKEWISSDDSGIQDIVEYTENQETEYIANAYGQEYIQKIAKHITDNDDFDNELLKQFGNIICEFLKKNSIMDIINDIQPCYDYPILHEMLDESIDQSKYKEIQNARDIAMRIVSIEVSKLKGIHGFKILSKLSYEITEEEAKTFDTFFVEIVNKNEFADMIEAFAENNTLGMIPQTIDRLSDYAFEEEGYASDVRKLLKLYTPEQKKAFWEKMESHCQYTATGKYEIPGQLIIELSKETQYDEDMVNVIENMITKDGRYYSANNDYLLFAIQTVSVYKNKLSQDSIDEYTSALVKALPTDTDRVLNAYRVVSKLNSENVWCENIDTILGYVTKGTYEIIYDIVISRIKLFNKKNNNLEVLADFLVDNVCLSDSPDDVINTISAHFSRIRKIDKLLHELMELEYDEDNASVKLAKLIDAVDMEVIITVIVDEWNIDNIHHQKLIKALSKSEKYSETKLPYYINENQENISKNDILSVLEFCEGSITEDNVGPYIGTLSYVLENNLEKDVYAEILLRISNLTEKTIEKQREGICTILVDIFKNSSSDEIRRKCSIVIKDKRFGKKIKSMLDEDELKEYRSYLS